MITIHKVDNYTNAQGIQRTYVCFKKAVDSFLGLKSSFQYGTMVLDLGITVEQATEALEESKDYSDQIEFIPQLDDNGVQTDFFRARPRA